MRMCRSWLPSPPGAGTPQLSCSPISFAHLHGTCPTGTKPCTVEQADLLVSAIEGRPQSSCSTHAALTSCCRRPEKPSRDANADERAFRKRQPEMRCVPAMSDKSKHRPPQRSARPSRLSSTTFAPLGLPLPQADMSCLHCQGCNAKCSSRRGCRCLVTSDLVSSRTAFPGPCDLQGERAGEACRPQRGR